MFRHLYGLPLFPASEDGEDEPLVDVQTWHHLCNVARRLEISDLPKQALEQLELYFEINMSIDENTGLLRDKTSIAWFVRNVELVYKCMGTYHKNDVADMISRFACRHFTELEESRKFSTLAYSVPALARDMLRYGARQRSQFLI
jgi:hypothetical protein